MTPSVSLFYSNENIIIHTIECVWIWKTPIGWAAKAYQCSSLFNTTRCDETWTIFVVNLIIRTVLHRLKLFAVGLNWIANCQSLVYAILALSIRTMPSSNDKQSITRWFDALPRNLHWRGNWRVSRARARLSQAFSFEQRQRRQRQPCIKWYITLIYQQINANGRSHIFSCFIAVNIGNGDKRILIDCGIYKDE